MNLLLKIGLLPLFGVFCEVELKKEVILSVVSNHMSEYIFCV